MKGITFNIKNLLFLLIILPAGFAIVKNNIRLQQGLSITNNNQHNALQCKCKNDVENAIKKYILLSNAQRKEADLLIGILNLKIISLEIQINSQKSKTNSTNNQRNLIPVCNLTSVHSVTVPNQQPFEAPCIIDEEKSVWTVIERRLDQKLSFNRNWEAYRQGFGDIKKEFFIGLEKLYLMTSSQPHELLIRLTDENGMRFARYSDFKVGSEDEGYPIKTLGIYSGNAGDGLRESENQKFSTFDHDNDQVHEVNCAEDGKGGWWLTKCGTTYLNIQHHTKNMVPWNNLLDRLFSIEILLRPKGVL